MTRPAFRLSPLLSLALALVMLWAVQQEKSWSRLTVITMFYSSEEVGRPLACVCATRICECWLFHCCFRRWH